MIKILDGKILSKNILKNIKKNVKNIKSIGLRTPCLVIIMVENNNESSLIYVNNKIQDCIKVGFSYFLLKLPNNISENSLIKHILFFNNDHLTDGLIVQLPLPKHLNQEKIILCINPEKDVDGFHPLNFGQLSLGNPCVVPATALAILKIFNFYNIKIKSKHTVVVGRSRIVGNPISILLSSKNNTIGNSTVTITHSCTINLQKHTSSADILIVAIGKSNFIKGNMIKKGSVLIDVGVNRISCFKKKHITGDIDFKSVYKKAACITPVPGGVGPVTRAVLLDNTLMLFIKKHKITLK